MANYSTLKAAVADVVKTNGTQAITGANLQAVLLSIINSVGGGGYIFKGVATPSTSAGTPDENVFYIGGAGTYANFGSSITIPIGSIGVFKYNGSWTKEQIALFAGIDDVPTAGSDNLVKSGGVNEFIDRFLLYGNNGTDVSNELKGLIAGRTYRVTLSSWTYSNTAGVSPDATLFYITNVVRVKINQPELLLRYYDFIAAENTSYVVGIRADLGDVVTVNVQDVSYTNTYGFDYRIFGKNYFNGNGYIGNSGGIGGQSDAISIYGMDYLSVLPNDKYNIINPSGFLIGYACYNIDQSFNSTVWFGTINSIVVPDNVYYIRIMMRDTNGLTVDSLNSYIALEKVNTSDSMIFDWLISESYTINGLTRNTDGDVTAASITWVDGNNGTLSITRDIDGNATSVAGTYGTNTYTLNIVRDSESNVVRTTKVKS